MQGRGAARSRPHLALPGHRRRLGRPARRSCPTTCSSRPESDAKNRVATLMGRADFPSPPLDRPGRRGARSADPAGELGYPAAAPLFLAAPVDQGLQHLQRRPRACPAAAGQDQLGVVGGRGDQFGVGGRGRQAVVGKAALLSAPTSGRRRRVAVGSFLGDDEAVLGLAQHVQPRRSPSRTACRAEQAERSGAAPGPPGRAAGAGWARPKRSACSTTMMVALGTLIRPRPRWSPPAPRWSRRRKAAITVSFSLRPASRPWISLPRGPSACAQIGGRRFSASVTSSGSDSAPPAGRSRSLGAASVGLAQPRDDLPQAAGRGGRGQRPALLPRRLLVEARRRRGRRTASAPGCADRRGRQGQQVHRPAFSCSRRRSETPKRCCSSTTARARSWKRTSSWNRAGAHRHRRLAQAQLRQLGGAAGALVAAGQQDDMNALCFKGLANGLEVLAGQDLGRAIRADCRPAAARRPWPGMATHGLASSPRRPGTSRTSARPRRGRRASRPGSATGRPVRAKVRWRPRRPRPGRCRRSPARARRGARPCGSSSPAGGPAARHRPTAGDGARREVRSPLRRSRPRLPATRAALPRPLQAGSRHSGRSGLLARASSASLRRVSRRQLPAIRN